MRIPALLLIAALGSTAWADASAYERIDAQVAMSDGVVLDASLYLPRRPVFRRPPLIVRQHGGGSNKDSPFDVQYGLKAVETGRFALLMYSARGHGSSGGLFDFFGPRTTQDFSEMLDWIAAHYGDRVNTNNVGSAGYSQGGGESLLPAIRDARVRALAVGNTFADLNHALNPNDAFKFAFATGIFLGAYTASASRVDNALAFRWGATFYTDTEDVGTPLLPSTTEDLASRSPQTYVDELVRRRVPVFWTNAWEDQLFPADHPERMLSVLEAHGVPVHYWFASGGHAAGASFEPEETAREQAMLDWFEQYLNGSPRGFGLRPRVDYWQRVTGDPRKPGEWEHYTAATWPVPGARMKRFYPRADGTLAGEPATSPEIATLINGYASGNFANDALVLEVANNIPGMGAVLEQIPEDANPLGTLTYTSAPLTQPLNVVGAPLVTVTQDSTHRVVQQLSAKVWDVGEDGARLIWRGAISGPLGGELRFDLWPNAHRFEPGHRIVLTISSVDFPTFKPDVEPWRSTLSLSGTRVELPVVTPTSHSGRSLVRGPGAGSGGGGVLGWLTLALMLALVLRPGRPADRR